MEKETGFRKTQQALLQGFEVGICMPALKVVLVIPRTAVRFLGIVVTKISTTFLGCSFKMLDLEPHSLIAMIILVQLAVTTMIVQ